MGELEIVVVVVLVLNQVVVVLVLNLVVVVLVLARVLRLREKILDILVPPFVLDEPVAAAVRPQHKTY
jgi:hypothetical protein